MKIGITILIAILLNCYWGFAKSPEVQDSLKTIKSDQKKTEDVLKKSPKKNIDTKGEKTKREKLQVKDIPFETKEKPFENKQLDSLKGYLSSITSELRTLEVDIQQLKNQQEENNKSHLTWDKILLLVTTVLVIGLFIFFSLDKNNRRDEILNTLTGRKGEYGGYRLTEFKNEIIEKAVEKVKQIPPPAQSSKSNNSEIELTIKDLQFRIADLEAVNRNKTVEISSKDNAKVTILSSKTLYADAIINSELNKVTEHPNDDTVYELFLRTQANKSAELTIFRDAYRRVIETPDFIEGCEKQRISNTPNNLHVEKGEAQLQDNGKWKIIKRVNVKFI